MTFVERTPAVASLIGDNLATLGTLKGHVVTQEAQAFLAQPGDPMALVFLDPPSTKGWQHLAAPNWRQAAGSPTTP